MSSRCYSCGGTGRYQPVSSDDNSVHPWCGACGGTGYIGKSTTNYGTSSGGTKGNGCGALLVVGAILYFLSSQSGKKPAAPQPAANDFIPHVLPEAPRRPANPVRQPPINNNAKPSDYTNIQGRWKYINSKGEKSMIYINANDVYLYSASEAKFEIFCQIKYTNSSIYPKQIDLFMVNAKKDPLVRTIYKIDSNELTVVLPIAQNTSTKSRPTWFDPEDTWVLQRDN